MKKKNVANGNPSESNQVSPKKEGWFRKNREAYLMFMRNQSTQIFLLAPFFLFAERASKLPFTPRSAGQFVMALIFLGMAIYSGYASFTFFLESAFSDLYKEREGMLAGKPGESFKEFLLLMGLFGKKYIFQLIAMAIIFVGMQLILAFDMVQAVRIAIKML